MWIHLDCTQRERETTVEGNVIPGILRHHQTFVFCLSFVLSVDKKGQKTKGETTKQGTFLKI